MFQSSQRAAQHDNELRAEFLGEDSEKNIPSKDNDKNSNGSAENSPATSSNTPCGSPTADELIDSHLDELAASGPLMRATGKDWRAIPSEGESERAAAAKAAAFASQKSVFFNQQAMQKDADGENGVGSKNVDRKNLMRSNSKFKFKEMASVVKKKVHIKELTKEEKEAQRKKMHFEFLEDAYERSFTKVTGEDPPMLEAAKNGQRLLHGPSRYMLTPVSMKLHELDAKYLEVQKKMWQLDPTQMMMKTGRQKALKLRMRGGTLLYNDLEAANLRNEMVLLQKRTAELTEQRLKSKNTPGIDMQEYRENIAKITVYFDREAHLAPHTLLVRTKEEGMSRDVERNWWKKMCLQIQQKFSSGLTIKYLHDAETLERINRVEFLRDGGSYVAGGYDEPLHVDRQHPDFVSKIPQSIRQHHKKPSTPTIRRLPPIPSTQTAHSASDEHLLSLQATVDDAFKHHVASKIKNHGRKTATKIDRYRHLFATRKHREAEAQAALQPLLDELVLPPAAEDDRVLKKVSDHVSNMLGKVSDAKRHREKFGDQKSTLSSAIARWRANRKPISLPPETVTTCTTPPFIVFLPFLTRFLFFYFLNWEMLSINLKLLFNN